MTKRHVIPECEFGSTWIADAEGFVPYKPPHYGEFKRLRKILTLMILVQMLQVIMVFVHLIWG